MEKFIEIKVANRKFTVAESAKEELSKYKLNEQVITTLTVASVDAVISNKFDNDGNLVYDNNGDIIKARRIHIVFNEKFLGIVNYGTQSEPKFGIGYINYLDISAYALTEIVRCFNDDVDMDFLDYNEIAGSNAIPMSVLKQLLIGAEISIDRCLHTAGSEYTTAAGDKRQFQCHMFDKNIIDIDFNDASVNKALMRLQRIMKR